MAVTDYPKTIAGLIVVMFASGMIAAFYPTYVGSDLCTSGGISGIWENVTDIIYFDDEFPAIARYYCPREAQITPEECSELDGLLNIDGCKWAGRLSSSGKTAYIIVDPPLEVSIDDKVKVIEDCKIEYYDVYRSEIDKCDDIKDENGTSYQDCKYKDVKYTLNRTICKDKGISLNLSVDYKKELDYSEFGKCSTTELINGSFNIICDSKYDSNQDGICTSGESCCVYNCTNEGCDFGNGDCNVNQYIERQQKKYDRLSLKVTDSISKVEVMVR